MQKEELNHEISSKEQRALQISTIEGAADRVAFGFGHGFITNFALALKANSFQIGVLSSLPNLLHQLIQPYSSRSMENLSRKKIVSRAALLEAILWIPMAILGFLFWKGLIKSTAIYLAIIVYALINLGRGSGYPVWFSWMGDIVPEKIRGGYFSKRNLIIGIVEISAALIGIALINVFEKQGYLLIGLAIFFLISSIFKILSYSLILKQYEPKFVLEKKEEFSFWDFIKRYDNFGKFAVYMGVFYFALMIASPFFMVYMVNELKFSTAISVGIMIMGSIFYLLFLPLVGKFSDKYGNLKLLYLANIAFAIAPLTWMISKNPIILGLVPQLFIGIANAALTISFTNFTYNAVSQKHRGLCASYTNILIGIGSLIGSLAGGAILNYVNLESLAVDIFFAVFILSALLRASTAYYFLPKIQEKKFKRIPALSANLTHPFKTIQAEIGWIDEISRSRYTEGLKIWENSKNYVLRKKI
ncbi:MAG: MFS transporter [Nanoarchaeota archaeon]